eukprot:4143145-Pyramimonas_sp.AAC.1
MDHGTQNGGLDVVPDVLSAQETRLKNSDKVISATRWCTRRGWHVAHGMAHSTGPGPTQSSSGVAVAVQQSIASEHVTSIELGGSTSRFVIRKAGVGFPQGMLFISAYFVTGFELTGPNLTLLESLG